MAKFGKQNTKGARLQREQVMDILERAASGETQASIGRRYNVTPTTVGRIVRGEAWQHLTAEHALNQIDDMSLAPDNAEEAARMAELDELFKTHPVTGGETEKDRPNPFKIFMEKGIAGIIEIDTVKDMNDQPEGKDK